MKKYGLKGIAIMLSLMLVFCMVPAFSYGSSMGQSGGSDVSVVKEGVTTNGNSVCNHSDVSKVDKVPATTTTNGNTEFYRCNSCSLLFSDQGCTQEISSTATTIPKISSITLSTTTYKYMAGTVSTPSVIVKDSQGRLLNKDTDYIVTYPSGRISVGTYKIVVNFQGNYRGSVNKYFYIIPADASIAKIGIVNRGAVITATRSASGYGANGFQIAYKKTSKGKVYYTGLRTYTSNKITGLKNGYYYYYKIRAIKKISGKSYYGSWSTNWKYGVVGANAATTVAIAKACKGKTLRQVQSYLVKKGYATWRASGSSKYSGDWCAWFVANCGRAAGVSSSRIPNYTYADIGYYKWAKNKKRFISRSKTPKVGDICFFDWGSGVAHVELVYKVTSSKVYTVGGNTGSDYWKYTTVKARSWPRSSGNIRGYARISYFH